MFTLRGSAVIIWHRVAERSIHLRNQSFLEALHFSGAWARLIIVATQMKEAVREVETELVLE
jgi:hypothetical protein